MKSDVSTLETSFPIRSYGKGELAMCYIPNVTQQTAVNQFNEWVHTCRRYTPAQVRLMVNVFGEP